MANTNVLAGTTPGGLPFPETSDPANQGANAIKALALALDRVAKLQSASVAMTTNAFGALIINPPVPLGTAAAPVVIATDGSTSNTAATWYGSRYTAGENFITLFAYNANGSLATNKAVRVNWLTIG